ncbi:MAG: hypothetical protein M5U09_29485 [Gammaproteobacteria bacterium]|nr:hypothetical protein [Gammaproteobacteria bacterium]
MRMRWLKVCAGVVLVLAAVLLALPLMVQAYLNQPDRGDWRVGGPHRTINALALEQFIGQAKSDPILAQYTFDRGCVEVQRPHHGRAGHVHPWS